jgi:hypothetical protein
MGRPAKHGDEVRAALASEYRKHVAAGTLPPGWINSKAAELGLHQHTVYRYIERAEESEVRARVVAPRSRFDHSEAMRGGGSMRAVHASKWEES